MNKMKKTYKPEELDRAKYRYMKYMPVTQISRETGIKLDALRYYVKTKWKIEREARKSEVIEALTESKRSLMFSISKNGLEVLDRAFKSMAADENLQIKPHDIPKIAGVINDLDKIAKLDDGSPTEILADIKPASFIEVKQLLKRDPFLEIEDAEFKEIKDNETDNSSTNGGDNSPSLSTDNDNLKSGSRKDAK